MPDDETNSGESGQGNWQANALAALRRGGFLLLLVPPVFVLLAGFLLYQKTNLSDESLFQLYDLFPSSYEIVSPEEMRKSQDASHLSVADNAGTTEVHVTVSRPVEYRARIIWLTAISAFILVSLCAAATSAWLAWKSLADNRFWILAAVYAVLLVWAPVAVRDLQAKVYPVDTEATANPGETESVSNPIADCQLAFEAGRELDVLSYCVIFRPLVELDAEFYGFAWAMHAGYVGILIVVMIILGTFAAATVAAPPRGQAPTPAFLAGQMHRGQIFLYATSAVLTFGLIYNSVWLRWPVELMPQGALRNQLSGYLTTVVGFIGVLASAILLSAYVPMALVHRRQAWRLARRSLSSIDDESPETSNRAIQEFLSANALQVPLYAQFQRIGAMLLPAMVNPVVSAFEVLTSATA